MNPPPRRLPDLVIGLLLLAAVLVIYSQVATHGFVTFDDPTYVTNNFYVLHGLSLEGFRWAFTTLDTANWYPLTHLSHMLDVQLFGLNAGAHALVNVGLHALATLLLFAFCRELTGRRWLAALVAVVFAIHPANVENVAWIAERKSVLCAGFCLAALLAYLRHARRPSLPHQLAVVAWFAGALMSKPAAVTLPGVFLLLDIWPLGRWTAAPSGRDSVWRRRLGLLVEKLPYFTMSAAVCSLTMLAQKNAGAVNPLPPGVRAANALVSTTGYLQMFVWPADLRPYYPYLSLAPHTVWIAAAAVALLGVGTAACWRRHPPLFVGACWFIGTLLPMVGLVQVGSQRMADRYLYLPMIGLALAVGTVLVDLAARSRGLRVLVCALAIPWLLRLGLVAHTQAAAWNNSASLFEPAANAVVQSRIILASAATGLALQSRYAEAESYWRRLPADDPFRQEGLARVYLQTGRRDEAAVLLRELARSPGCTFERRFDLAIMLVACGDPAAARAQFDLSRATAPKTTQWKNSVEQVRRLVTDPALTFERFLLVAGTAAP